MTAWYRTGTLSVTNGSATVTGSSTGWNTTVRAGDFLFVGSSQPVEVGSVVSNTQLTLVNTWAGATASGQSYAVAPGAAWGDVSQYAVEAARIIANAVQITGGSAVPSDADGLPDGTIYIRRTTGVADYYQKASGSYGTPLSLIGPAGSTGSVGPAGPSGPANSLAIGTVGTGAAGSSASATITGTAPSQTLNLTIPRGNTGATGATGPQGASGTMTVGSVTTGVAGSSAAVTNSGTSTAAVLDFTIPRGDTGAAGAAGADGDSFTHQGAYNSGTTYSYGHAVLDQNSTWVYINVTPGSGNAPPTLPTTSNSYWQLAARAGVDGTGSGTVTSVNGVSPLAGGDVTVPAEAVSVTPASFTPTKYTPAGAGVTDHLASIHGLLGEGNYGVTTMASAATVDIGGSSTSSILITGTTTITSFGSGTSKLRVVRFGGALTLTHNATTLSLPGGLNIATAANDMAIFVSDASGNWRCALYQPYMPQGQIKFPATQNASADANTLDDYEEGTFTPGITFGGGSTGITYTTQTGIYIKIGRLVFGVVNVTLSAKGSSTGAMAITGLPFAAALANYAQGVGYAAAFTGLTGALTVLINSGVTTLSVFQSAAATYTSVTDTAATNTTALRINFFYMV